MAIEKLVKDDLIPLMNKEAERLHRFGGEYKRSQEKPRVPRKASAEVKKLADLSRVPLLRLIVDTTAQPLFVDGYRTPESNETPEVWKVWTRNDFDSRQIPLHYETIKLGYAFATAVPGEMANGEEMPVLRGVSPMRMWAEYDDPYSDEFPIHALQKRAGKRGRYRYFDEDAIYELEQESEDGPIKIVGDPIQHGAGVTPIVRYENKIDLDGNCEGEIEPYLELARRIEKTVNDRLLVQHNNSWKIIWATGMQPPKESTREDQERAKLRIRQDDIIIGGSDVKFGELQETSMSGFLDAVIADIEQLGAVSQTPTSSLTGNMINLSADALAATRIGHTNKLVERQHRLGDSHSRLLRLAAKISGLASDAEDYDARVIWRDVEPRSLAQTIDALGKAAQMLDAPKRALWSRIPGVDELTVKEWGKMADDQKDEEMQEELLLSGQLSPTGDGSGAGEAMPTVDTGAPNTPTEYANQQTPWGAARGRRSSAKTDKFGRRKRKRDGDGDGVIDE